jgi:glycosyltransferase involved in cell wall biosynthesis
MAEAVSTISISIIVPVFNRPDEVAELLQSLSAQTDRDFELVIVEDGSQQRCEKVLDEYRDRLNISYFFKENEGPGIARNYGCVRAAGNYFIFVDSDCILPEQYISVVRRELTANYTDAFGGPDSAHESFSWLQKAINYAMTSFLTTGGIRGGGEKLDKFYPRSFNMGFSREVFEKTGGFPAVQFARTKAAGEDMELSVRIMKLGFSVRLIPQVYVFHKRRTSLKQFYRQTFHFGFARIAIFKRNQGALKLVHTLPSLFFLGSIFLILLSLFISPVFMLPILLLAVLLFTDATIKTHNPAIGLLATLASLIQLTGYGSGFLVAVWEKIILSR